MPIMCGPAYPGCIAFREIQCECKVNILCSQLNWEGLLNVSRGCKPTDLNVSLTPKHLTRNIIKVWPCGHWGPAKLKYKISHHKVYEFPHLGKFGICSEMTIAFLTLSSQYAPSGSRFGNEARGQGLSVTHGAQYQEQWTSFKISKASLESF